MWAILEPSLTIVLGLVVFTQLVLPPFIGKKFFWLFRKSEKEIFKAQSELEDATAQATVKKIKREVREIRSEKPIQKKRGGRK